MTYRTMTLILTLLKVPFPWSFYRQFFYISQYQALILYCYILASINLTYFNQSSQIFNYILFFSSANILVIILYKILLLSTFVKNIELYIPINRY